MGFHRRPPNSNVTLPMVGSLHLLKPGPPSGNWVQVVSVSRGWVVVRGVGNTHCEMRIPDWQFDDMTYVFPGAPVVQVPEEPIGNRILLEDGTILLLENGEELDLDLDVLIALLLEAGEELHTEAGELLTT